MEIRIVIDAPRGGPRRWAFFVATPLAFVALTGLWARASGVPNTFSANQTLSASQMNANFAAATTLAYDGGAYSVGATQVVGVTAAKTPGDMSGFTFGTGYAAARQACQFSFPSRQTVHMCTSEELVRSVQAGGTVPAQGWYSTGVYWEVTTINPAQAVGDCNGWTTGSGTVQGYEWLTSPYQGPVINACSNTFPILCCD